MRKVVLLIFAVLVISSLSGCETVKNTGYGVHKIATGIADDTYNTYYNLKQADQWLQDNAW